MVTTSHQRGTPFSLVVSGEAESWLPALERIVGPKFLVTYQVRNDHQLLEVVHAGLADAAVLDESAPWTVDVIHLLRMIRRMNERLPVVVVTSRSDRHLLEDALRLAAFSVVTRPLALEELLRQIQRMMLRLDQMLREQQGPGTRE
ncbi:MAG: response regulator [Phycisphaerae bacterium]|jgi:two-component system phosphoglycerate transport system response regulator PgtA